VEAFVRNLARVRRLPLPVLLGLAAALAIGGGVAYKLRPQPAAIPFPLPVYNIEATSGSCNASIANLGIGYVGAIQAPMPVDVTCDLLPDVLVAVNLVDIEGPVHDPLSTKYTSYQDFLADRVGRTIAPNVEINRYPLDALAIILGKPSPPLRINIKLTLTDLEGEEPDTYLRFGYDTAEGGSIPTHFKALVRGLEDFFNPLEAVVDTKGGLQGGDTVPTYYEGPLTLIGGIEREDGSLDADLAIAYSPFPDVVKVAYENDDAGNHIDYSHGIGEQILLDYGTVLPNGTFEHYVPGELPEVDMATKLDVITNGDTLNVTADIDRLPRRIGLDIDTGADDGRLDYDATTDGRLPDARINLRSVSGGELTRAQAFVEEIPPELHAQWVLGDDDDISALFTTSDPDDPAFDLDALGAGPGIGAIEVLYSNVDQPTKFTPFVATEQQYLNMQSVGGEQLVTGRIERIRGMSFASRADGFDIASRVGDGALPLEANIDMDGLPETGDLLKARATVSPLPAEIDVNLFSGVKGDPENPFRVVYDASHTVDIDGHAELREAAAAAATCGDPGTTCADIGVRHLPAHIEVAMAESGEEGVGATTEVAIDSVPRPGAPKPDVYLDAIMGKLDSSDDPDAVADAGPVLLEANGVLRGIPNTVRLRFIEGADETLERLDVATCELDVTDRCASDVDPIESLEVQVRNFRESERADTGITPPGSVAPQFATLTARGSDAPDKTSDPTVRFEAAARVRDIREVRYANVNGLFGIRSAIGDDRDLEVLLDVENVIFDGNDPKTGPVDLKGRALVSPLPGDINLCLRESGFPLSLSDPATFTDRCEVLDPFGDGSVDESPMTFSYDANRAFDVRATVDFTSYGLTDAPADNHDIHGGLVLDNVPEDLTAHIQTPPEEEELAEGEEPPPSTEPERLRVRTIAPGATNTNVDLEFEDRLGGASCAEPQPAGNITCVSAHVTSLPDYASVLADTGPNDNTHARVFACDLVLADDTCRADTAGVIDQMSARLRMVKGNPLEESGLLPFVFDEHPYRNGTLLPDAYVLALRLDQDDEENKELRAEGQLEQFRSLAFDRTDEGFDIRTDLGDNKTPLLGSIGIDTRVPVANIPPPAEQEEDFDPGKLIIADTRIDPLPAVITISQHGPGEDQRANPLLFSYESTAPVDVDARAQIFERVAGALCGDHGTMCASLHLDRLPTEIRARIGTYDESMPETAATDDVRRKMFVDLDAIPFANVDAPDLVMDAAIGATPEGEPPFDDTPIVAHGELHGFSEKARLRLTQSGKLKADESLENAAFEEALFVTCELVEGSNPPSCGDNPEFPVQEVAVSARNFHIRPIDFPVPRRNDVPDRNELFPTLSDRMYAEAVARGDDFEAHAGFTNVREFRMRNLNEILGVKVAGGDGQGFDAHGDLAGLVLPEKEIGEEDVDDGIQIGTLAIDAEASLTNVPNEFAFCMRTKGAPLLPLTGDFTEPCEVHHPFEDTFFQAAPPEEGPMAIAYRADDPITQVRTTANAHIVQAEVIPFNIFGTIFEITFPLPTVNVFGDVTIDNLPEHLTAHIETPVDKEDEDAPKDEGGPIRALFFYDDAPSILEGAPPVDIEFEAEYTQDDAICRDLRSGQVAFCFGGTLENLPSRVKAFIDPEAKLFLPNSTDLVKNLKVQTNNTNPANKMNLRDLDISVVKDDDPDKAPLVLVAEGDILGLPSSVVGTIHMPVSQEEQDKLPKTDPLKYDKPAFDIVATPPLDTVDVEVRNFIAPDLMPPVAAPRNGQTFDQQIVFQQRGDFFKALVDIRNVAGGGFRTGRNSLAQATETQLIRVDFGVPTDGSPKPTIRGYVDLATRNEKGDPTTIFADVLLDDMPHGIDLCFRGKLPPLPKDPNNVQPGERDHDLSAAPGTATFCDGVKDELGSFKFQGRVTGDPEPELDVDAIFRMTKDSDTAVLKAAATVRNIPNTIEGTFGDGAVSVQSYKANGTTPAGIDDVVLEMADFDFTNDGYPGQPPWGFRVPGSVILPPQQPGPAHEYARVAANGVDFHVKAHIGTAYDGTDGARITKFIMDPTACPKPAGADTYFPYYPAIDGKTVEGNEYKCVRGEFEQHSSHPLLLDADLVLDGTALQVLDAGLSEIPQWFQATIAKTPTSSLQNGVADAFRRRCKSDTAERVGLADHTARDCMPPLLHFDSEGNSQLFGRLLVGDHADVDTLGDTEPLRPMVDLDEVSVPPSVRNAGQNPLPADPWDEFPGGKGVRVKLGEFPKTDTTPERKAVRVSLRLDIPRALTVDQVQKWSTDSKSAAAYFSASDLRFHMVMRNAPASGDVPQIVTVAGQLAAMIHNFDGNGQTLVSEIGDDTGGIPIPGEFGIDLYERDYKGRGRKLIQADLRTSADLGARLRLVAGTSSDLGDSDITLANLRGTGTDPTYVTNPEKPSFRVRAEIKDPPDELNPPPGEEDDLGDALLCLVWCIKTETGKPKITADVNLDTDDSPPVRLLEAVLNTIDGKLGVELRSFADIDGTSSAKISADSAVPGLLPIALDPSSTLKAGLHVDIDPFNLFIHAGVPVLAGFDLMIISQLNVDLDLAPTDRFVLRNNTTVLKAASSGASPSLPDGGLSNTWAQVGASPGVLAAYFGLFWPFPPIYFFYGMAAGPAIPFFFYTCPTPFHVNPILPFSLPIFNAGDGIAATAFIPFSGPVPVPPLFTFGGTPPFMKPLLDAVIGLAGPPIMCAAFSTDGIDLHSGQPPSFNGDRSPGDPIVVNGHPVAGLGVTAAPTFTPPAPTTPPEQPSLTIGSGVTKTLCGTHSFKDVTLQSGGTINVGTAASDDPSTPFVECPANQPDNPATVDVNETVINLGRLQLVADRNITISGTVNGPTAPSSLQLTGENFTVSGSGRVNVNTGKVELFSHNMTMGGIIEGNGVSTSVPTKETDGTSWAAASTGNAGASHGGKGGTGTGAGGTVGPIYGSGVTADIEPGTEQGSKGGSTATATGGNGGGFVLIRGSDVTISGTIRMNGAVGQNETSGACSVKDNPDTKDVNEAKANTGKPAAGGGSGGGVAIHGVTLLVTGQIEAKGHWGGDGKGGGGGGGGGGVIRLNAGDVDPDLGADDNPIEDHAHVDGGIVGFSLCPQDFAHGVKGDPGILEVTETPQSHANPVDRFWFGPDSIKVPYRAAAAYKPGGLFGLFNNDDFVVYLCGIRKGPEAVLEGGSGTGDTGGFGLVMPTGTQPTSDNKCGTKTNEQPADATPYLLGTVELNNTEVSPANATITPDFPDSIQNGVWGLWTVSAKPGSFLDGSCYSFYPFYSNCPLESNPSAPEVIVGIDGAKPTFSISPVTSTFNVTNEAVVKTSTVTLRVNSPSDVLPRADGNGNVAVSGITGYRCWVDGGGGIEERGCTLNKTDLNLDLPGNPPAQGKYEIYVVATDAAGNTSAPFSGDNPDTAKFKDATVDDFDDDDTVVILDSVPPAKGNASITTPASPTGSNGWYKSPPTKYTIDGYDDGTAGSGQPTAGGFKYRFDGADWTSCVAPCTLQSPVPLPGPGAHTLSWKAVDAAGLESEVGVINVNIDGAAPETAVGTVPEFTGEWITAAHPFVVARGVDEFGGSGLEPLSSDPGLCDNNVLTGIGLSGTCISLTGIGGPYAPYTGPVELDSGTDQVICAYSVDQAGNKETPSIAIGSVSCTPPIDIDNDVPSGSISVNPPAPTGNSPWYDGDSPVPTVTLFGYDGTGSPEPSGGGFRYRIDNSFEQSCSDPCIVSPAMLTEGSNVLHWTVVDSAGNRRPEQKVDLFVDTDDPRSHLLVEPFAPAGSNGWYLQQPWVTLVGFDEPVGTVTLRPTGSGVQGINYTLDGNPFTYTGPFFVTPGDHEICVLASDVAGNDEAGGTSHCHRVAFDDRNPSSSVLQNGSLTPANDGANGWYRLAAVNMTQTSSDPTPGSGLTPQSLAAALCDHAPDPDPAPAGVCISVDGRAPGAGIHGPEFGPYTGGILLGEGEHVIRAFSVDNAGRRSAMDREVVLVDRSDPVSVARLRAPVASRTGLLRPWWRHQPTLVLRAIDGDQNAGINAIQYRLDNGAILNYTTPVTMPVGIHFVDHRAIDKSGRIGAWRRLPVAVDLAPPYVKATKPSQVLWVYVNILGIQLGSSTTQLGWEISDALSGKINVRVIIYSAAGLAVRHIDHGVVDVTPGVKKTGSTTWDGKDDSLLGFVPAGIYYYRVVATDDAGNVAQSGESERLQVKLQLKLL
jgi:hypothetical protein